MKTRIIDEENENQTPPQFTASTKTKKKEESAKTMNRKKE